MMSEDTQKKALAKNVESEPEDIKAYEHLRALMLGREQEKIEQLEHRLSDAKLRAADVGSVLPDAIVLREQSDNKLSKALMPTVEEAVKSSIKKNPQALSDILFPVMGPAIRKAMSNALAGMLQSLNQALEHAFSVQGLKWRWEAMRSGRSFAEVVMLKTLVYRVEQVFLIHARTGLLLQHVNADAAATQDADMVSGMLTAIQDFVSDSFEVQESESLEAMQVGGLHVWIEKGPEAVLAAVVRGDAPKLFRQRLAEINEDIHTQMATELVDFEGDSLPFEVIHNDLSECLEARYETGTQEKGILVWVISGISAAIILTWVGWNYYQQHQWEQLVEQFKLEAGIVLIEAHERGDGYALFGMRDALSRDPAELVRQSKVQADRVHMHWEPYYSLQDEFVLQRVGALLNPPDGVVLTVKNGILSAGGEAGNAWIEQARTRVFYVPGVVQYDETGLSALNSDAIMLRRAMEQLRPSSDVVLDVKNAVLYARGKAVGVWVMQSQEQMKHIEGIISYDQTALINIDEPAYILKQANIALKPPATVRLRLQADRLVATGKAGESWLAHAGRLAEDVHGVRIYDDSGVAVHYGDAEILQRAVKALQPSENLVLTFEKGRLTAKGRASSIWIEKAKKLALEVKGVQSYDDSSVIDIAAALAAVKREVETFSVKFVPNTARLSAGEQAKLAVLASIVREHRGLLLEADAHIKIFGNTANLGSGSRNHALVLERENSVEKQLLAGGVLAELLQRNDGKSVLRSPGKQVTFKLLVRTLKFEGQP